MNDVICARARRTTPLASLATLLAVLFFGVGGSVAAGASVRADAFVPAARIPHGFSSLINCSVKTLDASRHSFTVTATSLQTHKTVSYKVVWDQSSTASVPATVFYKGTYKTKGNSSELKVGGVVDVEGDLAGSTITAHYITVAPTN